MGSLDTPAMKQWRRAKQAHPDAVVLCKMGSFFEMFGEDAEIGATLLGLTLTRRNNGMAANVPMAGFPEKAQGDYVRKLVAAGKKVAILDQVEDPAKATGLVRREVTDVITPGVVLEENLLPERRNNFLGAIFRGDGQVGVAALDVSTGELRLQECSPNALDELLARWEMSEILTAEGEVGPSSVEGVRTTVPAWNFDRGVAEERILAAYAVGTLEGLGIDAGDDLLIRVLGGLLAYLREVRPGGRIHLKPPRIERGKTFMWLDRMTIQNLEILKPIREGEGQKTLLDVLDATQTPMGGRLLRRWVVEPLLDQEALQHRLDAVDSLFNKPSLTGTLRTILSGVRDVERLTGRLASLRSGPREIRSLGDSLAPLENLATTLADGSLYGCLTEPIDTLEDVRSEIDVALVDRPGLVVGEDPVIQHGYDTELDRLRALKEGSTDQIAAIQEKESEASDISGIKVGYNKVHGYYMEVSKRLLGNGVPEHWQRKQTLSKTERFTTPDLKALEEEVLSASDQIERLEAELFSKFRETVARHASRLLEVSSQVAMVDVLANLAWVAQEKRYVKPELHDGLALEIQAGRHPVVETIMPREDFIPNDVSLLSGRRFSLLTGPNMGGKSTLLRQVGLIQLMAQIGSFVPADQARLPICDRIFTRVGASDDLTRGQSTFMVEMTELSAILHAATERSLILLDEVGRGTATYDGVAIAWAATEAIYHDVKAKTVFATHYHELTVLAEDLDEFVNLNMRAHETDQSIVFLHKLGEGPADRSYGIECGKLAGLPPNVVARAREVLHHLEEGEKGEGRVRSAPPRTEGCAGNAAPVHPVLDEVRTLDLNRMTPLQAIQFLAHLQEMAE